MTVAPFQHTIDIVELLGRHVREMFEHSVASYDPMAMAPAGGFLQVSGEGGEGLLNYCSTDSGNCSIVQAGIT